MLLDIHGDGSDKEYIEHDFCPDLNCCSCECHTCKRAWEVAGRPKSKNCKIHSKNTEEVKQLSKIVIKNMNSYFDSELQKFAEIELLYNECRELVIKRSSCFENFALIKLISKNQKIVAPEVIKKLIDLDGMNAIYRYGNENTFDQIEIYW